MAIVAGTYSLGQRGFGVDADLNKSPVEADLERRREEKIDKERKEFEGRLKKAEEAHRAETQASSLTANQSSGVARKGWFSWANGSSDRSNDKPKP